jgi:hypothetical protein
MQTACKGECHVADSQKPSKDAEITCDEVVKLLGIDIDYQLNFNYHIKNICRKASQQLNVLKRIGQCTIFNKIKDVVNKNFNNKGTSIEP